MRTLGCTISLLLMLCVSKSLGQSTSTDLEEPVRPRYELPKRERDWKPSAFYISYDIIQLINSASSDRFHTEFNAKVDFDQFFLAFDYGWSDRQITETGFDYSFEGNYYRIGPEVDFMPYNKSRSSLFIGLKYAWSNFEDQITYSTSSDQWDQSDLTFANDNLKARWFEVNFGLSARIAGPVFMGYVVRFKLSQNLSETSELTPYQIPGYGRADKTSNFGFSYYITYRLGFRKKPVPKRPEKAKRLEDTKIPAKENE